MFYPVELDSISGPDVRQGVVVLNPAEGKRLIARAVAGLPEVKQAYARGGWR